MRVRAMQFGATGAGSYKLVVGFILGSITITIVKRLPVGQNKGIRTNNNAPSGCPSLMQGRGVPTFKRREYLGQLLQSESEAGPTTFTRGIELGVQQGMYSKTILSKWPSCTEYHLVDAWAHQENYKDVANIDQQSQNRNYDTTMANVEPWKDKIRVCRDYTSECVHKYEDNYFDFIYVDARHDFKGAYEDMASYWPKLKVGGIMAGHDYVTQDEVLYNQDWTVNYDGTKDETGTVVKGAVDKFASEVCRQVTVSYRENLWNTWAIRK